MHGALAQSAECSKHGINTGLQTAVMMIMMQQWAVAVAIAVLLLVARKARAGVNRAEADARAARVAGELLAEEEAEDRRRRRVDNASKAPRYLGRRLRVHLRRSRRAFCA